MLDRLVVGQKALQAVVESEEVLKEITTLMHDQAHGNQALTNAITTPFDEIPPTDLRTLVKDTSRAEIRWRGENLTDGSYDHRIISTDYPASVAYACSGFCAARMKYFLEKDSTLGLVACGSSGNRLVFTIVGPECDYEASCGLFSWLVGYCRGGGSAPLPSFLPYPFLRTLKLMDVAQGLGVSFLARRLEHKLIGLRETIPSGGELRAIIEYCRRDRCEDVLVPDEKSYHFIVDHIAMAIVSECVREGHPRYMGILKVLNDADYDPFKDDVGVVVDKKRAHISFRATTTQQNIRPSSGNYPVVAQAWADARAKIERAQARESGSNETLEEA